MATGPRKGLMKASPKAKTIATAQWPEHKWPEKGFPYGPLPDNKLPKTKQA